MSDPRRSVPGTDVVLADPRLAAALGRFSRHTVKGAIHLAQERARRGEIAPKDVADAAVAALPSSTTTLRPVINATGVVLHTNLGRAPLSASARAALEIASGYVDVEFDLADARRARRGRGTLDALRAAVPAAEDVHVVNNGAGALVLAATALARDREIIVSRGELIEIGDGFRLPDLLTSTGARIHEVGTTNRTTLADYRAALNDETAFALKVHPSNFRIEGFVASVGIVELHTLDLPVVADIGSGLLAPDSLLPDEPDVATTLRDGADLVVCSGDKLLGGPQAGLIFGRTDLVTRLRRHPLARALRVDKLTLAALEATLLGATTPTGDHLHADVEELQRRAGELADALAGVGVAAVVVPSVGAVGGGGAPGQVLPGFAVAIEEKYAELLRQGEPAVVARIADSKCLIDLRCVGPDDDKAIVGAVAAAQQSLLS